MSSDRGVTSLQLCFGTIIQAAVPTGDRGLAGSCHFHRGRSGNPRKGRDRAGEAEGRTGRSETQTVSGVRGAVPVP